MSKGLKILVLVILISLTIVSILLGILMSHVWLTFFPNILQSLQANEMYLYIVDFITYFPGIIGLILASIYVGYDIYSSK